MSTHQSPGGSSPMLQHGMGREQGQEVANLLQSFIGPLDQWFGPTDRSASGMHLVPGADGHCAGLSLTVGTASQRTSRPCRLSRQAPAGTKRLSNLLRSPKWSRIYWRDSSGTGRAKAWPNFPPPWPKATGHPRISPRRFTSSQSNLF